MSTGAASAPQPVTVFCAYSRKDEALRDRLGEQLSALERIGWIEIWHDRKIGAGDEWEGQIDQRLEQAGIILLLVSPSFVASDFCVGVEARRALERHREGTARVIPVILRPVRWQDVLGELQALPRDGKPVTAWPDQDAALFDVAEGIRAVVKEFRDGRARPVASSDEHTERHAPGAIRVNPRDGMNYVWVPPGTFRMGCSPHDAECFGEEKPPHPVTITRGFWMGESPVTVLAWTRFAAATGRKPPDETQPQMPMVEVTWDDAAAYCQWMGGRLPTEAEWEYAARAGTTGARYGDLDKIAWHRVNSGSGRKEVKQKEPNAFGLYDALGNVLEWVADWYGPYSPEPAVDPRGPATGQHRVLRGGSWFVSSQYARASDRYAFGPELRGDYVGFRCAWD